MLADDIRQRLALGQFGFEKLHPTTYLNNQRWTDEMPMEQAQGRTLVTGTGEWNTVEGWQEVF